MPDVHTAESSSPESPLGTPQGTATDLAERARMALAEAGYPDWPVKMDGDSVNGTPVISYAIGLPSEVRWRATEIVKQGLRPPRCLACHREMCPGLGVWPRPHDGCEANGRMFLLDCGRSGDAGARDSTSEQVGQ